MLQIGWILFLQKKIKNLVTVWINSATRDLKLIQQNKFY